jgi:tRNA nucleotidyltransferase/poly(A) polymerase
MNLPVSREFEPAELRFGRVGNTGRSRACEMAKFTETNLDFLPDSCEGIYLVGGAVRDLLAGHTPTDIDLVVNGDIEHVAKQIANKTDGSTIDLGKKGFAILRVATPKMSIDLTPLEQSSIEADLQQRDFTINAMAYDLNSQRMVDCTGGLTDMQDRRIRMISPAAFEKDPARLVRAYRMAAVMHYSISAKTQDAIGRYRHLVSRVAGERVWAELVKLFSAVNSASIMSQMAANGLLTAIFPEMQPTIGCTQSRPHQFDVFDHSLLAYEKLETLLAGRDDHFPKPALMAGQTDLISHAAMLKYAILLHDTGKPSTRYVDRNGRIRFPGHAKKSAQITAVISSRLKLSNRQRDVSDALIRHHIRPLFLYLAFENHCLGRRGMVRFFRLCGHLTLPIVAHAMADIMAKGKILQARDRAFISFCDRLVNAYTAYQRRQSLVPPLINGHDLIAVFGLSPSPRFKHILNRVDERRLSGELSTRDQALKWVEAYLKADAGGRKS